MSKIWSRSEGKIAKSLGCSNCAFFKLKLINKTKKNRCGGIGGKNNIIYIKIQI